MSNPVKPIPDGYHSVTPYLIISGAAKAIEFYKTVFAADEIVRIDMGGGTIGHAELRIGDSIIMLADEFPHMEARSPKSFGGTPVGIHLYVENCDATIQRAVAAGATISRPIQDQFYGDRSATLYDPFGHQWTISTHTEDLTPEEIKSRAAKLCGD